MRWMTCLLALVGCRFGFDDVAGDAPSAEPDAPALGAPCGIPFAEWSFSPPRLVDDINSRLITVNPSGGDRSEYDPVFSEDGLALHFSSDQLLRFTVWTARRSSLDVPFNSVVEESAEINAASNFHFGFQPLASLGVATISAPYPNGAGANDFWIGTRTGAMWTWRLSSLSTTAGDDDMRMTASGLTAYFVRGDADAKEIHVSTRSSIADDFGASVPVSGINSASSDSAPFPLTSGTGVLFASTRPGSQGEDVWFAPRSQSDPTGFAAAVRLDAINSAAFDGEPVLLERPDHCELVFISDRDGTFDLWSSLVTRR